MVLHLDAGRNAPAVTGYQSEHVAEAIHHESFVLLPRIACADHTLAHHIVGIVGVYALLRVLQFSCQVHVVHRDLAQ